MGVPALFRWLSQKYPKTITPVVQEEPREVNGITVPVDITKPNPNNEEFDNLYLDMNGIIHPCCHPEGRPAPETEEDMIVDIFKYMDHVVSMVRPRKLLYLAIDGVAPRAKMNQQRSRRFRAAQEAEEQLKAEEKAREERRVKGIPVEERVEKKKFDSNCITPGTPFMANLAKALKYYIAYKLNTDPGWKNLKVILSDATVPGEGEHKVMHFIRMQRTSPDHDPNTSHVIYGLDADLIMLSLATHEPHFKVLREDVFFQDVGSKNCFHCGKPGHQANRCPGKIDNEPSSQQSEKSSFMKPHVFMNVKILREYLEIELKPDNQPFPFDLERAIDDWVFLLFLVGNDFLPHLPSLEIREGAVDTLVALWKQCLPQMGDYITKNAAVDWKKAQLIFTELGAQEDEVFRERYAREAGRERAIKRRRTEEGQNMGEDNGYEQSMEIGQSQELFAPSVSAVNIDAVADQASLRKANMSAAALLKAEIVGDVEEERNEIVEDNIAMNVVEENDTTIKPMSEIEGTEETGNFGVKRKADEVIDDQNDEIGDAPSNVEEEEIELLTGGKPVTSVESYEDKVHTEDQSIGEEIKLWEPGFKQRYYRSKFGVELSDHEFRKNLVKAYVEGLAWVFAYYYKGCQSWKWFYPYYYAPFASDFVDIGDYDISFELGEPFRPFEQLMGVLPAASRQHLPEPFHILMTDESSEIIDFYPTEFKLDMNGKKFAWQAVVCLPFIDQARLLKAMKPLYSELTEEETIRNTEGHEILFVSESNRLYEDLSALYTKKSNEEPISLKSFQSGISGLVSRDKECIPNSTFISPFPNHDLPNIVNDKCLTVYYQFNKTSEDFIFKTTLLKGVNVGPRFLSSDDILWVKNGRGRGGNRRRGGGGQRNYDSYGSSFYGQYDRSHYATNDPFYGYDQSGDSYDRSNFHRNQNYQEDGNYRETNRRYEARSNEYRGGYGYNGNSNGGYSRGRGFNGQSSYQSRYPPRSAQGGSYQQQHDSAYVNENYASNQEYGSGRGYNSHYNNQGYSNQGYGNQGYTNRGYPNQGYGSNQYYNRPQNYSQSRNDYYQQNHSSTSIPQHGYRPRPYRPPTQQPGRGGGQSRYPYPY